MHRLATSYQGDILAVFGFIYSSILYSRRLRGRGNPTRKQRPASTRRAGNADRSKPRYTDVVRRDPQPTHASSLNTQALAPESQECGEASGSPSLSPCYNALRKPSAFSLWSLSVCRFPSSHMQGLLREGLRSLPVYDPALLNSCLSLIESREVPFQGSHRRFRRCLFTALFVRQSRRRWKAVIADSSSVHSSSRLPPETTRAPTIGTNSGGTLLQESVERCGLIPERSDLPLYISSDLVHTSSVVCSQSASWFCLEIKRRTGTRSSAACRADPERV